LLLMHRSRRCLEEAKNETNERSFSNATTQQTTCFRTRPNRRNAGRFGRAEEGRTTAGRVPHAACQPRVIVMWNHFGKRFSEPDGLLGRSNSDDSLAPPGTNACDAEGVAFRPEWREGQVRVIRRSAISCGPGTLTSSTFVVQMNCLRVCRNRRQSLIHCEGLAQGRAARRARPGANTPCSQRRARES